MIRLFNASHLRLAIGFCCLLLGGGELHAQSTSIGKLRIVPEGFPGPDTTVYAPANVEQVRPDGPVKNDWFYAKRAWPEQYIDPELYFRAIDEAEAMPVMRGAGGKSRAAAEAVWQSIGPYHVGGRVTALAMHPSDKNIFYVGAASGGVWKTTDHGQTFLSLTDTFATLPTGALTIDPRNAEYVYWGQGECNYSADSWPGRGLWRSKNGGNSWEYLGLAKTQFISRVILDTVNNRIYVCAPGPVSLGDTNRGVYRSDDNGATWQNLLRIKLPGNNNLPIIDLAMNPANPNELVAAGWDRTGTTGISGPASGLWYTSDAGSTWKRIDTLGLGYPSGVDYLYFNRTALYWAGGDQPMLYAAISRTDSNILRQRRSDANFHGLYRSASPATSWEKLQDSTMRIYYGGNNVDSVDILYRQGFYNFYLAGNPHRPSEIYIGAIDVHRSTDGGRSFTNLTESYGHYYFKNRREQHSDQHALGFTVDPSGNDLFVGSDGGVYHTTTFGQQWSQLKGMPITMFYSLKPWRAGMTDLPNVIAPRDLKIYGGTQDNGSVSAGLTTSQDWDWINRADGGVALSHPTRRESIFTSMQNGRIFLRVSLDSLVPNIGSDDGLNDPEIYRVRWHQITKPLLWGDTRLTDTSEPVAFIAPYVFDRAEPRELFTGRTKLYRALVDYDQPHLTTWQTWSPVLAGDTVNPGKWTGLAIEAIAVGPRVNNHSMLWVGGGIITKVGLLGRGIWRTRLDPDLPANTPPTWIDAKGNLPTALPSCIVPDRSDSLTAFIAFSRYGTGIWKTTNGGKQWSKISSKLPSSPVNALVIDTVAESGDPLKKNQYLIAATDVGVFATTDGGQSWAQIGTGLPRLVVNDLDIYKNLLIAGTHGRSAWALDLTPFRTASSVAHDKHIRELRVYPNPIQARNVLRVGFPSAVIPESLELISLASGTRMRVEAESAGPLQEYQLELQQVAAGTYVLRALDRDGVEYQTKVVVVQ